MPKTECLLVRLDLKPKQIALRCVEAVISQSAANAQLTSASYPCLAIPAKDGGTYQDEHLAGGVPVGERGVPVGERGVPDGVPGVTS